MLLLHTAAAFEMMRQGCSRHWMGYRMGCAHGGAAALERRRRRCLAHLLVDVPLQADTPMVPAGVADTRDGRGPRGTGGAVVVMLVVAHRSVFRIAVRCIMPAGQHSFVDRGPAQRSTLLSHLPSQLRRATKVAKTLWCMKTTSRPAAHATWERTCVRRRYRR